MQPSAIPEVRKSAEESFSSGLFCAESVLLAVAKAEGIDSVLLPRIATGFCSGMSRTCGTCGALTGAIMGVGLALGRSAATDSVQPSYAATRRLIEGFEQEFGSRDCKPLLGGCDLDRAEGQAMFREQRLGQRCLQFTGKAAELAVTAIVAARTPTMNPNPVIRDDTNADADAITDVTVAAFKTLEISRHTEQFVIAALRAAKALTVSLVAEVDGRVVGHIAFSPVTMADGTPDWYGLGPVSVAPAYQGQGIGKALIREGLSRLRGFGARGCCLVGHPTYYRQFGFENTPNLVHEGVPPEFFFALSFDGYMPRGTVTFHAAFNASGEAAAGATST